MHWLLGQACFTYFSFDKCHALRHYEHEDRGQLQWKRSCRAVTLYIQALPAKSPWKGFQMPLHWKKDTYRGWCFAASCRCQRAGSDRFLWQLRASFWLGLHAALWGAVIDFILFHRDFFTVAETPQRTHVFMFTPLSTATAGHTEQVRIFLCGFQSDWNQKWLSAGEIKPKLFKRSYTDWQASALVDHITCWLAQWMGHFGIYRITHLLQQVERQPFRFLLISMRKWYTFSFLALNP